MAYVYGILSVPVSFTYELRLAKGLTQFELPANEIISTALQTIDSIVVMLEKA